MSSSIEEQVVIALRQITRAIDLSSKKMLKFSGLSGPQLAVLRTISTIEPASVKQIASDVSLSSPTVLGILERLIQRGFVTKIRSDVDKRQSAIKLTKEGAEILSKTPDPLQTKFSKQFAKLEAWEKSLMLSSLQRIASMLSADDLDVAPILYVGEISSRQPE